MINIRTEKPEDIQKVHNVNQHAFETPIEADLVDNLRDACPDILSLVAAEGDDIVGHILFSPVTANSPQGIVHGMGLAPMAVQPGRQGQGIGSQLIRHGIEILREEDCPVVIVLGHPDYYPRFGFEPASQYNLTSQWDGVPDEAFMVMILDHQASSGIAGVASYREEFDAAM